MHEYSDTVGYHSIRLSGRELDNNTLAIIVITRITTSFTNTLIAMLGAKNKTQTQLKALVVKSQLIQPFY